MNDQAKAGTDWTGKEIDLIVRDYFHMLGMELGQKTYVKAQHNAELQNLIGRSRGSIEFKHQNISAVLIRLGLPFISGYKPLANFQNALIDGVGRFLSTSPDLSFGITSKISQLSEDPSLFVSTQPPTEPLDAVNNEPMERLVRKFDPAARDERNRQLGRAGEEQVFAFERDKLKHAGRDDLARKIRWVSEEDGDGAGYDILSYSEDGDERLLEVKTTQGHFQTPFYMSSNERALSEERPGNFRIFRVYDFVRKPSAFLIKPPLESSLAFQATNYRASLI